MTTDLVPAEEAAARLAQLPHPTCPHGGGAACPTCVEMCDWRPCWGTPADAAALVTAGYGDRLMQDHWVGGGPDGASIQILSPAIVGREGRHAPSMPVGRCTFLTAAGLCELHAAGLKPTEGRLADCAGKLNSRINYHALVAATWNTPDAQALAEAHARPTRKAPK